MFNLLIFSLNNNNNLVGVSVTEGDATVTQVTRHDFLVSFLVDARGGALNGCRHTGVKVMRCGALTQ